MRSKAPLAMMEQMVMILVFALAAALCLQAFVKSDRMSRESGERDRAAELCQSAAEAIRAAHGDFQQAAELLDVSYGSYAQEEPAFSVHYHEDWTLSDTREYAYCLRAESVDSGIDGLGKASVSVVETETLESIFAIEVCWQEVSAHG